MRLKVSPAAWGHFSSMVDAIKRRTKFEKGRPNPRVGEFYPELNSDELVNGARAPALWVAISTALKRLQSASL